MVDYTRLTINVHPDTLAAIKTIAKRRGISYTELIRRAVAVYKLIEDELAQGRTIQIKDGKNVREVVLVT
jgi:hypothetical protein